MQEYYFSQKIAMQEAGLFEPEFKITGFFTVIFRRYNFGEKVGINVGLNETQKKIMEIIASNPKTTAEKLSSIIGISKRKIEENIATLKQKGVLVRSGSRKSGYWEVVK